MNICELIGMLEDLREQNGDECDVFIAEQPSWPFENEIAGVVVADRAMEDEIDEAGGSRNVEYDPWTRDVEDPVIYILEGQQNQYLPGYAKVAAMNSDCYQWQDVR